MDDFSIGESATALAALEALNKACTACALRSGCSQVVVSDGPAQAQVVIVGEAPGGEEDRLGVPFVGPAGQLLDRILASVGIARADCYLTNVVKCRPPANRDPLPQESEICTRLWLNRQLELLRPRIILSLGNVPTQYLLQTRQGITRLRGGWYPYPLANGEQAWLMPLLHPAYLLRQDTRVVGGPKSLTWQDMKEVAAVLAGEKVPSAPGRVSNQPSLF